MATPTVRRLQLGNELRRWRDAANLTQEDAGEHIDASSTRMSRIELAQTKIAIGDVRLLMELYGADQEHTDGLLALARHNTSRGRWTGYRALYNEWFRMYVDLETDADTIRTTEGEIMPGLLQTEDYIRALSTDGEPVHDGERIANRVKARKERQLVLTRSEDPADVSFILSESTLRRRVGRDPRVMREQLGHLADMAGLPNVHIQILPFGARADAGILIYRFVILSIPSAGVAPPLDFVYLEDYDDARYLDTHNGVKMYLDLWGRLQAAALGPGESLDFIRDAAKDYR